eukprot:6486391-Amphidinium_carterae.2
MNEEPEPQPRCADDVQLPRLEPCLVDPVFARQLVVSAFARVYVIWKLPGVLRGDLLNHWALAHPLYGQLQCH